MDPWLLRTILRFYPRWVSDWPAGAEVLPWGPQPTKTPQGKSENVPPASSVFERELRDAGAV